MAEKFGNPADQSSQPPGYAPGYDAGYGPGYDQPSMGYNPGQPTNTTVIVQQVQSTLPVQGMKPWSSGVCACCDDCGICMLGWCCPCVLGCQVASALNENCCVPTCLQGGAVAMRTKLRTLLGIQGSICDDWCIINCCGVLAFCQMARQLKTEGMWS